MISMSLEGNIHSMMVSPLGHLTTQKYIIPKLTHGPQDHHYLQQGMGLQQEKLTVTIYVIGGGPEPGLSYSHANEVFHIK